MFLEGDIIGLSWKKISIGEIKVDTVKLYGKAWVE